MEQLRQYILTVIAGAVLCGILNTLTGGKISVFKLIAGAFLAFVTIRPIATVDLTALPAISYSYLEDGAAAAAAGEDFARESYAAIIKAETEAYILDKAESLEADLSVTVQLDENCIPTSVTLKGRVSPYAKASIESMLESDFGISEEDLQWIE